MENYRLIDDGEAWLASLANRDSLDRELEQLHATLATFGRAFWVDVLDNGLPVARNVIELLDKLQHGNMQQSDIFEFFWVFWKFYVKVVLILAEWNQSRTRLAELKALNGKGIESIHSVQVVFEEAMTADDVADAIDLVRERLPYVPPPIILQSTSMAPRSNRGN